MSDSRAVGGAPVCVPETVNGPTEVEPCPYCGKTSGVKVIPDSPPEVPGWSCTECGTEWWISVVNPHLRPWLDQLAEDIAALAVLREVIALREQAGTLTEGQLRARLIGCLVRLEQICRWGADLHAPAGYRLNSEVPCAQPVPPAANSTDPGTAESRPE